MNEQKYHEIVEGHGLVLEEIVVRVESLENREFPDYREATKRIDQAIGHLVQSVADVKEMATALPKAMPVEYIHKFDPKNKKVLLVIVGLVIALLALIMWVFTLYGNQTRFEEYALKYRFMRQVFPIQSDKADSAYATDPDKMKRLIKIMEDQAIASSHAQDIASQKLREAEAANATAKTLEKSSRQFRGEALVERRKK